MKQGEKEDAIENLVYTIYIFIHMILLHLPHLAI